MKYSLHLLIIFILICVSCSNDRVNKKDANSPYKSLLIKEKIDRLIENENGTISNIAAGDGEICRVTISLPEDMAEGEYPIIIKGTQLVEQNNAAHSPEPNSVQSKLTVSSYVLGDANNDGNVDAIDFNMIANKVLNISQTNFNEKAADINGDGKVDAIDFNMIANHILYGDFAGKQ